MTRIYLPAKRSKYGATRTDGFASKKEARRYQELLLLQKAGEIDKLECQVKFPLEANGKLICTYVADFTYVEKFGDLTWGKITEDCKGFKTPVYRLKKRLMWILLGIGIRET